MKNIKVNIKSITDVFFEDSPRIFTNLNCIDVVERAAANSVVRWLLLCRALQLSEILLVPDLTRSAPLDSLRPVLFCCVSLVIDQERVHFRPQSKKLGDRLAVYLVLEFPNRFVVGRVEEWTRLVERGEVEVLSLGE